MSIEQADKTRMSRRRSVRGFFMRELHPDLDLLLCNEIYLKARPVLQEYYPDNEIILLEALMTHLEDEEADLLGLTVEEGREFKDAWFKSLMKAMVADYGFTPLGSIPDGWVVS